MPKENKPPPKNRPSQPINRFQILGLDGDDSEDAEDDSNNDDVTTTTDMTKLSLDARTPWDVSSFLVA